MTDATKDRGSANVANHILSIPLAGEGPAVVSKYRVRECSWRPTFDNYIDRVKFRGRKVIFLPRVGCS